MPTAAEMWFQRLVLLVRVLGHQIKTPLTILTNEVAILESILPKDDRAIMEQKISEIVTVLKKVIPPGAKKLEMASCTLLELTQGATLSLSSALELRSVVCDKAKIVFALRELAHLLVSCSVRTKQVPGAGVVVQDGDDLAVRYTLEGAAPSFQRESSHESFTEWLMVTGDVQSIAPPLIDAILLAHEWRMAINHSAIRSTISITIQSNP